MSNYFIVMAAMVGMPENNSEDEGTFSDIPTINN